MDPRDIDERIGRLVGATPFPGAIVSSDGGKSMCAWVSREGPWYTRKELRDWLDEGVSRGLYSRESFLFIERDEWPHYSTDIAAAMQALEWQAAQGEVHVSLECWPPSASVTAPRWSCTIVRHRTGGPGDVTSANAETAPAAICEAMLKANGAIN